MESKLFCPHWNALLVDKSVKCVLEERSFALLAVCQQQYITAGVVYEMEAASASFLIFTFLPLCAS